MKQKLTEKRVREIAVPEKSATFLWDTEQANFGIRVTPSGTRSYIVEKRVHGRVRRRTLGKISAFNLKDARILASQWLVEISGGGDPIEARREAAKQSKNREAINQAESLTLGQAFDQFLEARTLKPATVTDYKRIRDNDLKSWQDTRLVDITAKMVTAKHRALYEQAKKQDKRYCRKATGARANAVMRVLRAVFNFARHNFEAEDTGIDLKNPVSILTANKSWYRTRRKNSYLSEADLPIWYAAVMEHRSEKMREFLLLLLFTGLRRGEAAGLLWRDVDFNQKTLKIIDPKNHQDHILPLSDYLLEMLERRHRTRGAHNFVFPGRGEAGHLVSPWDVLQNIRASTGIECSVHDCRRNFSVMAAPLVPYPTLKRLLNHKTDNNDVTLGYAIPDLEELRGHMQRITDKILRIATRQKAEVIRLHG